MTNKEKLRKAIEEDINPKDYYKNIIRKIEEGEKRKMKKDGWKWAFIPICFVVISGFLLMNTRHDNETVLKSESYEEEKNTTLNINEITNNKEGLSKLDADIKTVTANDVNYPLPYKNGLVNIPKDLDKSDIYIVYTKKDINSTEYNRLYNYIIEYNDGKDRSIQVAYSKDNKPIRDYYFDDTGSKITTINGMNLKIYKYEKSYYTEFKFNDYNFDIETSNITEQEFRSFLVSIFD